MATCISILLWCAFICRVWPAGPSDDGSSGARSCRATGRGDSGQYVNRVDLLSLWVARLVGDRWRVTGWLSAVFARRRPAGHLGYAALPSCRLSGTPPGTSILARPGPIRTDPDLACARPQPEFLPDSRSRLPDTPGTRPPSSIPSHEPSRADPRFEPPQPLAVNLKRYMKRDLQTTISCDLNEH